jgi:hypothetical protein
VLRTRQYLNGLGVTLLVRADCGQALLPLTPFLSQGKATQSHKENHK